ncbi:MAG: hypothetical protein ABIA75_07165, partial [Candidatus Neomarinimicrobiota bacterium]
MNKIKISAIFIFAALLSSQTLEVNGQFNQFFTYYISSVDINTGETDIQLFSYRLDCPDCPTDINGNYSPVVAVDIKFKMTVRSAALGIDDEKTIMSIYTKKPIKILAPVQLDNRDFTLDALDIFDEHGNLVSISIGINDDESLDDEEMMDMFNAIVQTAQLPDGEYKLSIDIEAGYYDFSSENWTVKFPV